MTLKEFKTNFKEPLRQSTLLYLVKDDKILIAKKKRGFGEGKYNGIGGKPENGESILETAIRETKEEIGVIPTKFRNVAILEFYFVDEPIEKDWNQEVIVYIAEEWNGEPVETEEMLPEWFDIDSIPYDKMWADDIHWLPRVLKGQFIKAQFLFDKDENIVEFDIKTN